MNRSNIDTHIYAYMYNLCEYKFMYIYVCSCVYICSYRLTCINISVYVFLSVFDVWCCLPI